VSLSCQGSGNCVCNSPLSGARQSSSSDATYARRHHRRGKMRGHGKWGRHGERAERPETLDVAGVSPAQVRQMRKTSRQILVRAPLRIPPSHPTICPVAFRCLKLNGLSAPEISASLPSPAAISHRFLDMIICPPSSRILESLRLSLPCVSLVDRT
jgi:hypothetical protein